MAVADEWSLYVVQTANNTLYTGISNNVALRFEKHQLGKGARYLKGKGPLALVYSVEIGSKSRALKSEFAFKKLTRTKKLEIIKSRLDTSGLMVQLGIEQ